MTTGSSRDMDALLLRDLARAGGRDGIAPEHTGPRDPLDIEYWREQVRQDPSIIGAALIASLEEIARLRAWVDTVLDRVPEAYGDDAPAEVVIDRWLNDLVDLYDAAGYWRTEYQLGRAGVAMPSTYKAAGEALAAAYDRVRTDEETTDAG